MTTERDNEALDAELRRIEFLPADEQPVALAKLVQVLESQLR